MKYLISAMLFLIMHTAIAQFTIITDNVSALPLNSKRLQNALNTPYLFDEIYKGEVKLADGNILNDLNLLYDLDFDIPICVNDDGIFFKFNYTPISFKLKISYDNYLAFKQGFIPIEKNSINTFYQILVDGKLKLLKKYSSTIIESIPYGTSTTLKTKMILTNYYITDGSWIKKIKNNPKLLLKELQNKNKFTVTFNENTGKQNENNEKNLIIILDAYNNSLN